MNFYRHGDVNLFEVDEIFGEIVKHDGKYILARGEATGSVHELSVEKIANLLIKKDKNGYMQFELLEDGKLIHTHDHEILTIKIGKYVQIPERELDHFSNSVARNVVDWNENN